jgi:translation elongation factor EF-G
MQVWISEVTYLEETITNYDAALKEYRLLWNNRLLTTTEGNSEQTLKDAIKRELLDENSHPRIRKTRFEKYYSAVHRIVCSDIPNEAKLQLIKVHNQIMENLNGEIK